MFHASGGCHYQLELFSWVVEEFASQIFYPEVMLLEAWSVGKSSLNLTLSHSCHSKNLLDSLALDLWRFPQIYSIASHRPSRTSSEPSPPSRGDHAHLFMLFSRSRSVFMLYTEWQITDSQSQLPENCQQQFAPEPQFIEPI